MARGYAVKLGDGSVQSTIPWFDDRLVGRMANHDPGLYRISTTREGARGFGRPAISVGARCKDIRGEADRMRLLGEKRARHACTAMPGVQGYQQREAASTSAAAERKKETQRLARWLAERCHVCGGARAPLAGCRYAMTRMHGEGA